MNGLKRIINIFLAPVAVFEEMKSKAGWLLPLSLYLLISLLSTYLLLPTVIIPNQIAMISANPELTIEQKNAFIAGAGGATPYITATITALLLIPLLFLFLAGLVALIRVVFGGEAFSFKKIFAATCYIGLIGSLGTILTSIIMYTQNIIDAAFNLALFFPGASGFAGRLLSGISVFGLWQTALFALLLMAFYQYSRVKAFSIMFVLYLAWQIVFALLPTGIA